jgi:hypothetical protein
VSHLRRDDAPRSFSLDGPRLSLHIHQVRMIVVYERFVHCCYLLALALTAIKGVLIDSNARVKMRGVGGCVGAVYLGHWGVGCLGAG